MDTYPHQSIAIISFFLLFFSLPSPPFSQLPVRRMPPCHTKNYQKGSTLSDREGYVKLMWKATCHLKMIWEGSHKTTTSNTKINNSFRSAIVDSQQIFGGKPTSSALTRVQTSISDTTSINDHRTTTTSKCAKRCEIWSSTSWAMPNRIMLTRRERLWTRSLQVGLGDAQHCHCSFQMNWLWSVFSPKGASKYQDLTIFSCHNCQKQQQQHYYNQPWRR